MHCRVLNNQIRTEFEALGPSSPQHSVKTDQFQEFNPGAGKFWGLIASVGTASYLERQKLILLLKPENAYVLLNG